MPPLLLACPEKLPATFQRAKFFRSIHMNSDRLHGRFPKSALPSFHFLVTGPQH